MTKQARQIKDLGNEVIPVVKLSNPQEIDGSSASAATTALDCYLIRIFAVSGTVRFVIGSDPTATSSSIPIAEGSDIYQPIKPTEKVAIYGGVANITECS